jgi:hypothetical protein
VEFLNKIGLFGFYLLIRNIQLEEFCHETRLFYGDFWGGDLVHPFFLSLERAGTNLRLWLPAVYLHIPFWHCMGLFVLVAILRGLLFPWRTFNSWKFNYKGWHR